MDNSGVIGTEGERECRSGDRGTGAVSVAQDDICESIQNDSSLLANAQDRAKKLIENCINQLGETSGTEFTVKWESVSNTSSENQMEF